MKDRLSNFMKSEGLSPGRLADILGVQPSSISHLVSGRNKPGFDFIYKILQQFPRLSPDWLIAGTGSMYRTDSIPVQALNTPRNAMQDSEPIAAQPIVDQFEFELNDELLSHAPDHKDAIKTVKPLDAAQAHVNEDKDHSVLSEAISDAHSSMKSIERIVIFFNNNTFKEYLPE